MIVQQGYTHTTLAFIAMKSLSFTTYTTNSTFITMKNTLLFCIVIIKCTNITVVWSKILIAFYAGLRLWLHLLTSQTFYCSNFMSIKIMMHFVVCDFLHHLIMTQSTIIELAFTSRVWTLLLAATAIMLTPNDPSVATSYLKSPLLELTSLWISC